MNEQDKQTIIEQVESGEAILVAKWHYKEIFEALDWLIKAHDFHRKSRDMSIDDSPKMLKAIQVRDIVGMDFSDKIPEPPQKPYKPANQLGRVKDES